MKLYKLASYRTAIMLGVNFMELELIIKAAKVALVFNIKVLLLLGVYFSGKVGANHSRKTRNPSWGVKLPIFLKAIGVLAIIALIFAAISKDDDDEQSRFNPWAFSVVILTALPALYFGMEEGFRMEEEIPRGSGNTSDY